MSDTIYCTILAGGTGSRLWPLSQPNKPKQFIDLLGLGKTMLQLTYDRFRRIASPENFIVVTLEDYRSFVREQLPELPVENILCEPFKRNTAASIAFANEFAKQKDPEATMVVTPSDHLITDDELFLRSVRKAADYAGKHDQLMAIGIKATRPDTAFGYIQVGDIVDGTDDETAVHSVRTFTEKPNAEMAQIFYDCGDFCWNSGVFVWKLQTIEKALKLFLPTTQNLFDILNTLPVSHWSDGVLRHIYEECENTSIDYGVMEKAQNVAVSLSSAVWSDLGGWGAIYEQGARAPLGNATLGGESVLKNSEGCLIHTEPGHICVVDGLKDYMVIQRNDVTLICPRDNGIKAWTYVSEINAEHSPNK